MLFEDNKIYTFIRFLVILFGTTGMTLGIVRFEQNFKKKMLILCAFMPYAIIVTLIPIYFSGWDLVLRVFFFTISLPAMVIMFFLSGESLPRLIFTRMTLLLFSVYIAGSATFINGLMYGTMLSSILIHILMYAIVIFIEFRFIRKSFLYIADTIQKGWGILALIPCALLPLTLLVGRYPRHFTETPTGILFVYLLFAVILILYSAIFRYLILLHTKQMSERNMELLELQVQNIRRENENSKVLEKQTKIIRHDMKHMLSVIASLSEKEDTQAILNYTDKFIEENTISESPQYCSDPFLDTTLSHYFNHAKNMGYMVETSLSIPDTLPVDSAEFAICFSNALECAMNLGDDIPEKKEKKLVVRCIDAPKLMFEVAASCKNSLSFDRNKLPKTENINQNLNIYSIREFCRRHDAVYSFTEENGWFTVQIALQTGGIFLCFLKAEYFFRYCGLWLSLSVYSECRSPLPYSSPH